jgi:hypothetical protein
VTDSPPDLLVLHAVRILGFADDGAIARRFALDGAGTSELLLDAEAHGWVSHTSFAGLGGWSLTERGRAENERRLAAELAATGKAGEIRDVHRQFLPLNARLQSAATDWQLRPTPHDPLAANDHSDAAWDTRVLQELAGVEHGLGPLAGRLSAALPRFRGYDTRFAAALRRARDGESGWVDRTDVDSCHRVWFELHEDLIATLGLNRGAER